MTGKLSQFWQELKRRGVIKVLTMYAASAFIILEAADIILPRWGLSDWIINLIILLLILGLVVSAILAWIFDLTPSGIKKTEPVSAADKKESPVTQRRKLRISDIIIAALFIIIGILVYPKLFNKDPYHGIRDLEGKISVAVLPFENLTGDNTLDWMQKGISSLVINHLGSSPELAVRDDHTMSEIIKTQDVQQSSLVSAARAKDIAEKANSETYITGSFQGKDGNFILLVNLSRTKNGDIFWTSRLEGDLGSSEYLDLIASLCDELRNYLEIKALDSSSEVDIRELYPKSAEAYKHFIEGVSFFLSSEYRSALESFTRSWEMDTTFAFCSFYMAFAHEKLYEFDRAREWTGKTYDHKESIPPLYRPWLDLWHAAYISRNEQSMRSACHQLEMADINSMVLWLDLGLTYWDLLGDNRKAVDALDRMKAIARARGEKVRIKEYYMYYANILNELDQPKRSLKVSKAGLRIFPKDLTIIGNIVTSSHLSGNEKDGLAYLDLYRTTCEQLGFSRDFINWGTARIYRNAGRKDEAIDLYREMMAQAPLNPKYWNELGLLLIEDETTREEGFELIREAVKWVPNDRNFLWSMGLACKQMGRYEEALKYFRASQALSRIYSLKREQVIDEVKQNLSIEN